MWWKRRRAWPSDEAKRKNKRAWSPDELRERRKVRKTSIRALYIRVRSNLWWFGGILLDSVTRRVWFNALCEEAWFNALLVWPSLSSWSFPFVSDQMVRAHEVGLHSVGVRCEPLVLSIGLYGLVWVEERSEVETTFDQMSLFMLHVSGNLLSDLYLPTSVNPMSFFLVTLANTRNGAVGASWRLEEFSEGQQLVENLE